MLRTRIAKLRDNADLDKLYKKYERANIPLRQCRARYLKKLRSEVWIGDSTTGSKLARTYHVMRLAMRRQRYYWDPLTQRFLVEKRRTAISRNVSRLRRVRITYIKMSCPWQVRIEGLFDPGDSYKMKVIQWCRDRCTHPWSLRWQQSDRVLGFTDIEEYSMFLLTDFECD